MKRKINLFFITLALLLFVGLSVSDAQGPPPPPDTHGATGDQPANGAPIGTGIILMTGLFAAYAARKAWNARQKLAE
jgi:hypothetical protein